MSTRASTTSARPAIESQILRSMSNLRISRYPTFKKVDPLDCRFLKRFISRWFDNGLSYQMLTDRIKLGQLSYIDVPPVKVYEALGAYYVRDGNKRLKALQEARSVIHDIRINVEVIGNVDDLLNELRKQDYSGTVFDIKQLGKTVRVY